MERLFLIHTNEDITRDGVTAISQRFPSLNRLDLHPWQDAEEALIVSRYYPRMNTVDVAVNVSGMEFSYWNQADGFKEPGITEFSIVDESEGDAPCPNVSTFLHQHHTSIQRMRWDIDTPRNDHAIYDIHYPQLKRLTLGISGWWIPRKAPMLQELKIEWFTVYYSPAVLDTIPPNLKRLTFDLNSQPEPIDNTPTALSASTCSASASK